jgi:hypothetical protein
LKILKYREKFSKKFELKNGKHGPILANYADVYISPEFLTEAERLQDYELRKKHILKSEKIDLFIL